MTKIRSLTPKTKIGTPTRGGGDRRKPKDKKNVRKQHSDCWLNDDRFVGWLQPGFHDIMTQLKQNAFHVTQYLGAKKKVTLFDVVNQITE